MHDPPIIPPSIQSTLHKRQMLVIEEPLKGACAAEKVRCASGSKRWTRRPGRKFWLPKFNTSDLLPEIEPQARLVEILVHINAHPVANSAGFRFGNRFTQFT